MCKKGDIILIKEYKDGENVLSRHSFVVIDDEGGRVCGLDYDFVALVMSSFKDEQQRKRKLEYPGNFEITAADKQMQSWANGKDGYIKAEQFYYFEKPKLNFRVIGSLTEDTWDALVDFIEELSTRGVEIKQILDNLT
jgi:hypothetical protein